ncbi:hypothetical protein TWF191_008621 [Orbilia oligospora]|uniref:SH3 domain-containing protein n=1 Tax=Orbilia oligospora TaxID=2813651 RepID=A0A7C8R4K9_ORBOL|nr:hypothetical protein TWF191_008621 [Orbilia oligospora]
MGAILNKSYDHGLTLVDPKDRPCPDGIPGWHWELSPKMETPTGETLIQLTGGAEDLGISGITNTLDPENRLQFGRLEPGKIFPTENFPTGIGNGLYELVREPSLVPTHGRQPLAELRVESLGFTEIDEPDVEKVTEPDAPKSRYNCSRLARYCRAAASVFGRMLGAQLEQKPNIEIPPLNMDDEPVGGWTDPFSSHRRLQPEYQPESRDDSILNQGEDDNDFIGNELFEPRAQPRARIPQVKRPSIFRPARLHIQPPNMEDILHQIDRDPHEEFRSFYTLAGDDVAGETAPANDISDDWPEEDIPNELLAPPLNIFTPGSFDQLPVTPDFRTQELAVDMDSDEDEEIVPQGQGGDEYGELMVVPEPQVDLSPAVGFRPIPLMTPIAIETISKSQRNLADRQYNVYAECVQNLLTLRNGMSDDEVQSLVDRGWGHYSILDFYKAALDGTPPPTCPNNRQDIIKLAIDQGHPRYVAPGATGANPQSGIGAVGILSSLTILSPPQFVTPVHEFERSEKGDLEIKIGDVIEIKRYVDKNWYKGTNLSTRKKGIFPIAYVKEVEVSSTKVVEQLSGRRAASQSRVSEKLLVELPKETERKGSFFYPSDTVIVRDRGNRVTSTGYREIDQDVILIRPKDTINNEPAKIVRPTVEREVVEEDITIIQPRRTIEAPVIKDEKIIIPIRRKEIPYSEVSKYANSGPEVDIERLRLSSRHRDSEERYVIERPKETREVLVRPKEVVVEKPVVVERPREVVIESPREIEEASTVISQGGRSRARSIKEIRLDRGISYSPPARKKEFKMLPPPQTITYNEYGAPVFVDTKTFAPAPIMSAPPRPHYAPRALEPAPVPVLPQSLPRTRVQHTYQY